jgi:hypothetical protein
MICKNLDFVYVNAENWVVKKFILKLRLLKRQERRELMEIKIKNLDVEFI